MWETAPQNRQRANFYYLQRALTNQEGKDKQPNRYMCKVQEQADSREKQCIWPVTYEIMPISLPIREMKIKTLSYLLKNRLTRFKMCPNLDLSEADPQKVFVYK